MNKSIVRSSTIRVVDLCQRHLPRLPVGTEVKVYDRSTRNAEPEVTAQGRVVAFGPLSYNGRDELVIGYVVEQEGGEHITVVAKDPRIRGFREGMPEDPIPVRRINKEQMESIVNNVLATLKKIKV